MGVVRLVGMAEAVNVAAARAVARAAEKAVVETPNWAVVCNPNLGRWWSAAEMVTVKA